MKVVVEFGVNQLTLEKRLYVAGLVTESDDVNVRVGDDVTARGKQCNTILGQCKERCKVIAECTVTLNEGRQKWLATSVQILRVEAMETIVVPTNEVIVNILTTAIALYIQENRAFKTQIVADGADPSTPGGKSVYDAKIASEKKRLFDLGAERLAEDLRSRESETIGTLLALFQESAA